jgi:pimeloyl-ACP methyl ester carboxylesterase
MAGRATSGWADGGTPVVLVHGLGMSGRYMLPLARRLAPHVPVLVPDLPGFGASSSVWPPLAVTGLARGLHAWLDALAVPDAVLVGHSLGCQVAVALALHRPERVQRLVLVAPTIDAGARRAAPQGARLARDLPREPARLLALGSLDYLRGGLPRGLATFRHALHDPVERALARLRSPVLVVRGEHDPVVPQAWAQRVAGLAPGGRLTVVPGAPHAPNFSHPAAVAAEILRFLEQ